MGRWHKPIYRASLTHFRSAKSAVRQRVGGRNSCDCNQRLGYHRIAASGAAASAVRGSHGEADTRQVSPGSSGAHRHPESLHRLAAGGCRGEVATLSPAAWQADEGGRYRPRAQDSSSLPRAISECVCCAAAARQKEGRVRQHSFRAEVFHRRAFYLLDAAVQQRVPRRLRRTHCSGAGAGHGQAAAVAEAGATAALRRCDAARPEAGGKLHPHAVLPASAGCGSAG